MTKLLPENLTFSEVGHLPIVKDFAKKIKLVETLDAMVDSQMDLSPGITVLAMVLDTLSGRTPLYRLEEFFQEKDTELIFGHDVKPELFCDYNVGRVLDKLFDTGTQKIFSKIAQNAIGVFDVDLRRVHFDTTSISVFEDYDFIDPPLNITYGHSKYKRPDLKQFLISMLCVDRIPILGATEDGNASDKTLNNELLGDISRHMAKHGIEQNFGFLKDPVIVNSIFLKKPNRIEVLGLVLLISLLVWHLMERCMRRYLDETESEIIGWKNRPTKRPTSFMMTTKFLSILVAKAGKKRQLVRPLRPVQLEYLQAMGVNPEVFVIP